MLNSAKNLELLVSLLGKQEIGLPFDINIHHRDTIKIVRRRFLIFRLKSLVIKHSYHYRLYTKDNNVILKYIDQDETDDINYLLYIDEIVHVYTLCIVPLDKIQYIIDKYTKSTASDCKSIN